MKERKKVFFNFQGLSKYTLCGLKIKIHTKKKMMLTGSKGGLTRLSLQDVPPFAYMHGIVQPGQ